MYEALVVCVFMIDILMLTSSTSALECRRAIVLPSSALPAHVLRAVAVDAVAQVTLRWRIGAVALVRVLAYPALALVWLALLLKLRAWRDLDCLLAGLPGCACFGPFFLTGWPICAQLWSVSTQEQF